MLNEVLSRSPKGDKSTGSALDLDEGNRLDQIVKAVMPATSPQSRHPLRQRLRKGRGTREFGRRTAGRKWVVPPPRLERGTPRSTNRDHLSRFKPHSDYSRAFPKTAHQALGCRVRMRPASFVMPFGECSRVDRRGASRSRRSAAA